MSLPKVERVSITLPQLQVALIGLYSGWISARMIRVPDAGVPLSGHRPNTARTIHETPGPGAGARILAESARRATGRQPDATLAACKRIDLPMPVILRVAIPVPLRQLFDYLPVADGQMRHYQPGQRVLAPFGGRRLPGILVAVRDHPEPDAGTLRPLLALLDEQPPIPEDILALADWAARYYHTPIGEVLACALPAGLRQGNAPAAAGEPALRLTAVGQHTEVTGLRRAPRQAALLTQLQQTGAGVRPVAELRAAGFTDTVMRALLQRGLAERTTLIGTEAPTDTALEAALALNPAQQTAVSAIRAELGHYACLLLEGVTGSGKTEVYLQAIAEVLAAGRQALVLVPEIGLTPQLLSRFQRRFGTGVHTYHSGLSDREREHAWQAAARGEAQVLIGTRSAVFMPQPALGLIVIDEEHDPAFRQQDGFRYSARDVAVKRAFAAGIPVVLGSATPSAESMQHALAGRYRHLQLPERAGQASVPAWRLVDIRHQHLDEGLSPILIEAIRDTLHQGRQALLFLNRRGFAPTLLCHDCGWSANCPHCSAGMTLHSHPAQLQCHHCGHRQRLPAHCPHCQSPALHALGLGTQRSEQGLKRLFPDVPVLRIDRDSSRGGRALEALLDEVHAGRPCLLVGTQMLAKGHHFPHVTLVGVLDADAGLFAADFRGPERMGQVLTQVAGRAGRGAHPGQVLIQTHRPEHPWLGLLTGGGYRPFLERILAERQQAGLPPFGHLALLRADATEAHPAEALLRQARQWLGQPAGLQVIGPLPAAMERRAGRHRFLLLLQAQERQPLHAALDALEKYLPALPGQRRVRWAIDVDPLDML